MYFSKQFLLLGENMMTVEGRKNYVKLKLGLRIYTIQVR